MKINAQLRTARTQDMTACAAILNNWIDETPWMPRIYSRDDVVHHYKTVVAAERKMFVVASNHQIAGMMALDKDQVVTALYVGEGFRRQGVGKMLLDCAKREFPDHLSLWTFQANTEAQKFYQREGFVEINRTDGDNEEGLPDVLLEWRARLDHET
jgi:ribosomal protein S18 acetylase RimI-like enzyme